MRYLINCFIFLLFLSGGIFAAQKIVLPESETGPMTLNFIQGYSFDPLKETPSLPPHLVISSYEGKFGYYIIQFPGPIREEWKRDIIRIGGKFLDYIHRYAFLVRLPNDQLERVRELPQVRWVGLYQPVYKIFPYLDKSPGVKPYIVGFFYDEDEKEILKKLEELGATNIITDFNFQNKSVKVEIDGTKVDEIAKIPGVYWIEHYIPITPDNVDMQWVDQTGWRSTAPPPSDTLVARRIWGQGLTGQGIIVSITDTPMWLGHDLFRDPNVSSPDTTHRKVIAYTGAQGSDAHGTHTTGTLCGDDGYVGGTSYYDGLAKHARVYFQNYTQFPNWDMNTWLIGPYNGVGRFKARNHSMSLSRKDSFSTYVWTDRSLDQFVWNHKDFLHCNSMGNYNLQPTMGHPPVAKNLISVGSCNNGTGANQLSSFTSIGPTLDGRRKPTLVSPGANLYSAGTSGPSSYVSMSGTSMATPNMTAATALIRQYFVDGYYPSGTRNPSDAFSPSAALMKAVAIVGADNSINYEVPSNYVGWGRINLDSSLYFAGDAKKLWVKDDTVGLQTGDSAMFEIEVTESSEPFRVALVWSDYPGTPYSYPILINNLDLTVIDPAGTEYKGSVYSGGQSVPGGSYDTLNVEECVRRNSPMTGRWKIKVKARNVPQGPQPFALAVTGAIRERPPSGIRHQRCLINDNPPNGNGDGIVNPGESIEMPTWVMNYNTYPVLGVKTWLRLTPPDPNITITDSFKRFPRIEPQDSAFTGSDGFNFSVSPSCTNNYRIPFTFVFRDTLDSIWQSGFSIYVGTPVLFPQGLLVWDSPPGGNGNGRIDPGEYASLAVGVKNSGLGHGYQVTAILKSADTRFTILDSFGRYDTILKDSVKFNLFDKFRVYAQPNIPREFPVPCTLKIFSENWIFIRPFTIVIGEVTIADPIPDGPRTPPRYWAYDDIDTLYTERPRFNWIELRNRGTQLPITSDDQTIRIPLPFVFKYYGIRYTDSLSVCSNGWISPIRTTSAVYTNQPLPDPTSANPSAMICPNWDDLYPPYGNRIWYLYEPDSHRFILEWDSVHYYSPNTQWDKFEIIVYDTTIQTATGDNEIIFQYLTANNYTSNTVGIEDETNQIGINAVYNNTYDRRCAPLAPGRAIKITTDEPIVGISEPATVKKIAPRFLVNTISRDKVAFMLSIPSEARIEIYSITGRKVRSFKVSPQEREITWFGEDESGKRVPNGIYIVRLVGKDLKERTKIIYLR